MRKAVHFFPVLMLAGCASMSADNCSVADWGAAGFEDGARGDPFATVGSDVSACPVYAAFDVDAYLDGVSAGLSHYCDPANAFAAGAAGAAYYGVCLGREGEIFETAYGMGERAAELRLAEAGDRQTIADTRAELWEVKQRESEVRGALADAADRADRRDYREELTLLAADRARLEAQIASMTASFAQNGRTAIEAPAAAIEGGTLRPLQASY